MALSERLALISHMREVESFAVLGRVATSLLHEIQGAINPVVLAGCRLEEALDRDLTLSDTKSKLRELIQHAQRVAKLARMNLHTIQKQQREWIHVPTTIERIVKLMRAVALNQGAALEIKGRIPPVTINLQPQVLEQPLINLFDNALFYSRSRSWAYITISACVAGDDTITPFHIWVEDNGLGMTAEQRGQLFSPRISAKGVEGVGLGLYVSRNLLQAVGGDLVLEDTVRWFGSRFCIRLPMILKDVRD